MPQAASTPSIGAQIDSLNDLREQVRAQNKIADELSAEYNKQKDLLIASLEAQGVEQSRGSSATATITKQVVPNVIDWDAFYAFIKDNDAFYLLERRAASAAYREILETREGESVPGIQPYEKVGLSLRTK